MGKNLRTLFMLIFVISMVLFRSFQLLKHHNKMVLQGEKNRTLQEMSHVTLNNKKPSKRLWAKVINTTYYTINRVYFCLGTRMTPYEIWKGKKPNASIFICLVACIIFLMIVSTWVSLIPKVILVYFLVALITVESIVFIT